MNSKILWEKKSNSDGLSRCMGSFQEYVFLSNNYPKRKYTILNSKTGERVGEYTLPYKKVTDLCMNQYYLIYGSGKYIEDDTDESGSWSTVWKIHVNLHFLNKNYFGNDYFSFFIYGDRCKMCLWEHKLAYEVHKSVFEVRNLITRKVECRFTVHPSKRQIEDCDREYIIQCHGDKLVITVGTDEVFVYDTEKKELLYRFSNNENDSWTNETCVNSMCINSSSIVTMDSNNDLRIRSFDGTVLRKFPTNYQSYLDNVVMDISETFLVLSSYKGWYQAEWILLYDFQRQVFYLQNLGIETTYHCCTISENRVVTFSLDYQKTNYSIKAFEIFCKTPTPLLTLLKGTPSSVLGNVHENMDVKRLILEFSGGDHVKDENERAICRTNNFLISKQKNRIPPIMWLYEPSKKYSRLQVLKSNYQ